jgi:hypothetical protein
MMNFDTTSAPYKEAKTEAIKATYNRICEYTNEHGVFLMKLMKNILPVSLSGSRDFLLKNGRLQKPS